jgi:dephospho-CoA kinase
MLVELGAGLLDADRTGHAVLAEDVEVRTAIRARWGDSVFTTAGDVNRSAVAARVFGNNQAASAERQFLESLLHPRIRRRLEELRDRFAAEGKPAVVLDAPLLLEAAWQTVCSLVLMVDAPREVRLARARERGWSEAEFDRREAAQWPVERKRASSDAIIQNAGTESELREAVLTFWRTFIESAMWGQQRTG